MIVNKKEKLTILLLLLFISGFAQSIQPDKVIKIKKYSDTTMSTTSIRAFVNDFIRITGNKDYIFLLDGFPPGKYRFYIKSDECCNFSFDKTRRVTNVDTGIKFDLKEADIKLLNISLRKPIIEYYANDVLIENCNDIASFPVFVEIPK